MNEATKRRLGKIVELAKQGIGGEKTAALRMVKAMCREHDLDFDEVMQADERMYEYAFKYRTSDEHQLAKQIAFKYATCAAQPQVWNRTYYKEIIVKCTAAQYIETAYAMGIYLREYRKQKKLVISDLAGAFTIKNHIYPDWPDDDDDDGRPELTDEQRAAAWRRAKLVDTLDHVKITKAIESGKK